jgi:hypothetical protein
MLKDSYFQHVRIGPIQRSGTLPLLWRGMRPQGLEAISRPAARCAPFPLRRPAPRENPGPPSLAAHSAARTSSFAILASLEVQPAHPWVGVRGVRRSPTRRS